MAEVDSCAAAAVALPRNRSHSSSRRNERRALAAELCRGKQQRKQCFQCVAAVAEADSGSTQLQIPSDCETKEQAKAKKALLKERNLDSAKSTFRRQTQSPAAAAETDLESTQLMSQAADMALAAEDAGRFGIVEACELLNDRVATDASGEQDDDDKEEAAEDPEDETRRGFEGRGEESSEREDSRLEEESLIFFCCSLCFVFFSFAGFPFFLSRETEKEAFIF